MTTRIRNRRGTAAEWASANPVLTAGELGVETDTKKLKAGDGSTAWNALGYAVGEVDPDDIDASVATYIGANPPSVADDSITLAKLAPSVESAVQAVSTKADDSAVVKLTGSQTVAGLKDFSTRPKVGGVNVLLAGEGGGANITGGGVTADTWTTATAYTGGRIIAVNGRTYFAKNDHTSGATFAGDLTAHWALAGLDPARAFEGTLTKLDADSVKLEVPVTFDGDDYLATFTGDLVPVDGPPDDTWLTARLYEWTSASIGSSTGATWPAAFGGVDLVGTDLPGGAPNQVNSIVTLSGGVKGYYRGQASGLSATIPALDLTPSSGKLAFGMVLHEISTENSTFPSEADLIQIGAAGNGRQFRVRLIRGDAGKLVIEWQRLPGTGDPDGADIYSNFVQDLTSFPSTTISRFGDYPGVAGTHVVVGIINGETGSISIDGVPITFGSGGTLTTNVNAAGPSGLVAGYLGFDQRTNDGHGSWISTHNVILSGATDAQIAGMQAALMTEAGL